jgi:glucose/arabinose dehydrogenase
VVGDPIVTGEVVGEFDQPIDLAVRAGDDALWFVEQSGRVVRFDGGVATTALDLTARVSTGGEQGLLGLTFTPDGGLAYVNFTDTDGVTTIAEYAIAPDATLDPTSERILLQVPQPYSNHNAGDLAFGPDGMLYVPLGDGGSGGDPQRNGSNPETLLGSLLRLDPTPSGDRPYTIPPDNPFASGPFGDGIVGAPEVWAWGLRNPWKIAFDPLTGDLWIPDVGQNEFEEINVVGPAADTTAARGADFGWSAFEGTERFDADVADSGRVTAPVLTYSHADGCSISGGVPYRGTAIPELAPAFVYSDYCTGTIWALDLAGGRNLTLIEGFDSVASVRAGPDGELYVLERSGTVHRLVAG